MTTYERTKKAAVARMGGESTGAWKLADALVADIPSPKPGPAESSGDVPTRLREAAQQLMEDGIETPAGEAYTPDSLRELRLVAMAWPPKDRHEEAAFRTHQEAGKDPWRREVLGALCEAAQSEDYELPELENGEIDDVAWLKATTSIAKKIERNSRYPVSANDFRVALKRKKNTPEPEPDDTVLDAVEAIQEASDKLASAVQILAHCGSLDEDTREIIEGLRERLGASFDLLATFLDEGGITDEALAELLRQG